MSAMSYRDDREALHHRVAQLEQELQDARREGEEHGRDEAQARAVALEKKLADMRGEVEKMGAELEALRGKSPRRLGSGVVALLVAGIACCAAVPGVIIFARRPAPPPTVVLVPPEVQAPMGKAKPAEPIPTVEPPTVTEPLQAPTATPASARTAEARWTAKVSRAEGLPLAPGSACTVTAIVSTRDTNAIVNALTVECGAQSLYRSSDRLNGMSQSSNDAREVMGPTDEKSTFTLAYRDIGTRTGERTQIDLDSTKHQASVFRETIPRFRVDLSLPATSLPGPSLSGREQRLHRTGKVSHVTGAAPVKEGASCVLRAMATGKRSECTAEVACGTSILWPSSAPVSCTYEASRPTSISTNEGPTGVSLDGSTLNVKGKGFEAEITLAEP